MALALELADIADEVTRAHFQPGGMVFENKYDGTPVTEIDRAAERAIREHLAKARPGHVVLGEEAGLGDTEDLPSPPDPLSRGRERGSQQSSSPSANSSSRWIVDPIDGTKKFVRGIPLYATLIGLEVAGEIVVGVASAPMMERTGRRWWAAKGLGAFADGRRIHVSTVERLADAHVLYGSLEGWLQHGRANTLLDVAGRAWGTTGYGDFWVHLLVAEGAADAALECRGAVWDLAALKIIVEEAGGRFTDFTGQDTAGSGNGMSTNGRIHEEVLALLR